MRLWTTESPVYPACAGIDPVIGVFVVIWFCLPRMRGDRPLVPWELFIIALFTPHARGSTALKLSRPSRNIVYPACAGIDPGVIEVDCDKRSLPRMRGDRP